MELSEYLEALRNEIENPTIGTKPFGRAIRDTLGIHDNYSIFVQGDFAETSKYFSRLPQWLLLRYPDEEQDNLELLLEKRVKNRHLMLDHTINTSLLQIFKSYGQSYDLPFLPNDIKPALTNDLKAQLSHRYNFQFMFHTRTEDKQGA